MHFFSWVKFGIVVCWIGLGLSAAAQDSSADLFEKAGATNLYLIPKLDEPILDPSKIKAEARMLESGAAAAALLARNAELPNPLKSKLLTLALSIDPAHKIAIETNQALSEGALLPPVETPGVPDLSQFVVTLFRVTYHVYETQQDEDGITLLGMLFDVCHELHPEETELAYSRKIFLENNRAAPWQTVLTAATEKPPSPRRTPIPRVPKGIAQPIDPRDMPPEKIHPVHFRNWLYNAKYDVALDLIERAPMETLIKESGGSSVLTLVISGDRASRRMVGNTLVYENLRDGSGASTNRLVKALMSRGFDPNFAGSVITKSPLLQCIEARQFDAAKLLIGFGATFDEAVAKAGYQSISRDSKLIDPFFALTKQAGVSVFDSVSDSSTLQLAMQSHSTETELEVSYDLGYPHLAPLEGSAPFPAALRKLRAQFAVALFARCPKLAEARDAYRERLDILLKRIEEPDEQAELAAEKAAVDAFEFPQLKSRMLRLAQRGYWEDLLEAAQADQITAAPLLKVYFERLLQLRGELLIQGQAPSADHIWRDYNRAEQLLIATGGGGLRWFESHGFKFHARSIVFIVDTNDLSPQIGKFGEKELPEIIELATNVIEATPEGMKYQVLAAGGPCWWQGQSIENKLYPDGKYRVRGGGTVDWKVDAADKRTFLPDCKISDYPTPKWLDANEKIMASTKEFLAQLRDTRGRADNYPIPIASQMQPDAIVMISTKLAINKGDLEAVDGTAKHPLVDELVKANRNSANARIFSVGLDGLWLPELSNRTFGRAALTKR